MECGGGTGFRFHLFGQRTTFGLGAEPDDAHAHEVDRSHHGSGFGKTVIEKCHQVCRNIYECRCEELLFFLEYWQGQSHRSPSLKECDLSK